MDYGFEDIAPSCAPSAWTPGRSFQVREACLIPLGNCPVSTLLDRRPFARWKDAWIGQLESPAKRILAPHHGAAGIAVRVARDELRRLRRRCCEARVKHPQCFLFAQSFWMFSGS